MHILLVYERELLKNDYLKTYKKYIYKKNKNYLK